LPSILIDGVLISTGDPSIIHGQRPAEGTKTGPKRVKGEKAAQSRAITALVGQLDSVIYAVRFPDGVIKIGYSTNFAQRLRSFRAKGGEVLGFMAGDFEAERAIHSGLVQHRARGFEYYRPEAPVLDVVNTMRAEWNLPPVDE
jgi:hypothetical protein